MKIRMSKQFVNEKIPFALFNSKALFNPYQYKPFFQIMSSEKTGKYEWNGKNLFITDEVGVGKTFEIGIILREMLRINPNLSFLVICPVKLCSNWQKEMRENFYIEFHNFREDKFKTFKRNNIVPYSFFSSLSGSKTDEDISIQEKEEKELVEKELDTEEVRNLIETKMQDMKEFDVIILDEAHYIRNKGKLWTCIKELIAWNEERIKEKKFNLVNNVVLRIFMTATPIFNTEKDYENITELLCNDRESFATTTTLQGEANCYDFLLDIKVEEVHLSGREKEILDDLNSTIFVEEDNYEIEKAKYGRLTGFLKRISASSFYSLSKFLSKQSGNYNLEGQDLPDDEDMNLEMEDLSDLRNLCEEWETKKEDSKLESLISILEKAKEEHQSNEINKPFKVILFSCFLDTCDYLEKSLMVKNYRIFKITGKSSYQEVSRIKKEFEKNEKDSILVCSDAAKEGHNFQFCQNLIHYDFPFTPAALGQRNGRIYRQGQEGNPKVYYISVKDSYDERLFGEIIFSKSEIVKGFSNENKVSILNVLPEDSEDYERRCIKAYFNYLVGERKQRDDNNSSKNEGTNYTLKEILFQLKKKYYNNAEDKWLLPKMEKEYEELKNNGENLSEEVLEEKFINLFLPNKSNEKDNQELFSYYQTKYTEELKNCIHYFGGDIVNLEGELHQSFYNLCKNTIQTKLKDTKLKFCHDMFYVTQDKMSIAEYREQFVPLYKEEKVYRDFKRRELDE